MPIIVEELKKEYPTRSGSLSVLNGVNLTLQPGESVAITGPSGSGKSTLLHILGTLDHPTSGKVRLDDSDPFTLNERELAQFRNRKIGFIFQDHHLLAQCSVLENVLIPTLIDTARTARETEAFARELLQKVGLTNRQDHRPAELSGGERQRVAIARALIQRPTLVLADEPTGNLDRKNAHSVAELLLSLLPETQTCLVVVTHSLEIAKMFARHYEMIDGTLQPVL